MDPDITEIEDAVRRLPPTDRVHLIEVIARSLRDPEPEPSPALSPNKAALGGCPTYRAAARVQ